MGIAKSIDLGQPAQFLEADHGRNILLFADFLCINSVPHDKFLDWFKLKALILQMTKQMWIKN